MAPWAPWTPQRPDFVVAPTPKTASGALRAPKRPRNAPAGRYRRRSRRCANAARSTAAAGISTRHRRSVASGTPTKLAT